MTREKFLDIVCSELRYGANKIIDAADQYAENSSSGKSNQINYQKQMEDI